MELRFVSPTLADLDRVGMEVLAAALFADERPPRGVAGLLDWRCAGRLSRLIQTGFVSGELGEVLMLPGKPSMPFDKVILFGAGSSDELDHGVFGGLVERLLGTLEGLRARTAVVQLPGRHSGAISPESAVEILLQAAAGKTQHDVWTLVESAAGQKAMTDHLLEKRRRRGA